MSFYEKSQIINPTNIVTSTAYLFTLNYDDRKTPEQVFQEYRRLAGLISKDKKEFSTRAARRSRTGASASPIPRRTSTRTSCPSSSSRSCATMTARASR